MADVILEEYYYEGNITGEFKSKEENLKWYVTIKLVKQNPTWLSFLTSARKPYRVECNLRKRDFIKEFDNEEDARYFFNSMCFLSFLYSIRYPVNLPSNKISHLENPPIGFDNPSDLILYEYEWGKSGFNPKRNSYRYLINLDFTQKSILQYLKDRNIIISDNEIKNLFWEISENKVILIKVKDANLFHKNIDWNNLENREVLFIHPSPKEVSKCLYPFMSRRYLQECTTLFNPY